MYSNLPIIPGECVLKWTQFETDFVVDLMPKGPVQMYFAKQAARIAWKIKRITRLEAVVLLTLEDHEMPGGSPGGGIGLASGGEDRASAAGPSPDGQKIPVTETFEVSMLLELAAFVDSPRLKAIQSYEGHLVRVLDRHLQ